MPTFDTPEPISVVIEIEAGHVRLLASDRADTVVEVNPADASHDAAVRAAEAVQVEYANGQLLVQAPKHRIRSVFSTRAALVDVTIMLPSGSRVDAKGAATEFRSEGRLGDSTFETAAGAIRLDQTGRVKLRTSAGDVSIGRSVGLTEVTTSLGRISIGAIEGSVTAKTSNGDINVGEVTGDVQLKTANGDITIKQARSDVGAKTAYGSVRIGEIVSGTVEIETNFGALELGIREGTAAWLDAHSKHGTVRTDLDSADGPADSDQTVRVHARTSFGDILIRRS